MFTKYKFRNDKWVLPETAEPIFSEFFFKEADLTGGKGKLSLRLARNLREIININHV